MIHTTNASHKSKPRNPFSRLGFLHILNDGFLASFPLLLPFIQKDFNVPYGKIGLLSSLLNMAGVILALPAASISMRFGGYRVLVISMFLYSSAFFVTGISSGFYTLMFAFMLASVGFGMFHPISFALIANASSGKDIGNKMGNFTAVGDIGRIGIAAFVTVLVSMVNWRCTSFIYGLFPLLLFFLSFIFCQKIDFASAKEKGRTTKVHGLRSSLPFIAIITTGFIDSFASSSLFIFLPFLFVNRGASTALLGSLSAAFFIGNMIGKVFIGKITDIFGCKKVFLISELAMSFLLILLASVTNIFFTVIISILLGAVTKGTVPVINALLAKSVPDRRLNEKAFGIVSLTNGISSVIAPVFFGFVAQRCSINAVFQFSACVALSATLPIVINKMAIRGNA